MPNSQFKPQLKHQAKHQPNASLNKQFNAILKAVSRSFYLSIRVLPNAMRQPIAIAYLLARAADAIADTADLDETIRLKCLLDFRDLLSDKIPDSVSEPIKTQLKSVDLLIANIDHAGERELLSHLPGVFMAYHALSPADFNAVKKVVSTLTQGMEKDLRFFTNNENSTDSYQIKALPDDDTLDEYTYFVAGCVGEFWTDLSILHVPSLSHWQQTTISHTEMPQMGVQFGKALQLTNILRDIAKDAKLKRCYLPASDLNKYQLNTDMLLDKKNNIKFKPVISKWLKQADSHFFTAEAYLLSIPRHCLRLRLASLWPILIGLATLKRIKQKENFLDINCNVKVKRSWVYKMLLFSVPASFSNTLLRYWIKSLRNVPST